MHPNNSEYTATGKALLESQLAAFSAMTSILAEGAGQAFALTVAAAKASTEASVGAAKQSLTASDPQAVLALATALGKEHAQRLTSYAGDLMNLRFSTRAELAKIVTAQLTNMQGEMHGLIEDIARNAPAGAERVFALLKPIHFEPTTRNSGRRSCK